MNIKGTIHWLTERLLDYARRPLHIKLRRQFGQSPNQRDLAEAVGRSFVRRALRQHREVLLDFEGVGLVTQGFFHALLDEAITEDVRHVQRIRILNASKPQAAVFSLAMRYMAQTASPRARVVVKLPVEAADSGAQRVC